MESKTIEMNSEYIKMMRDRFDEILARGAWEEVQDLFIEMENDGYQEFVPMMSQMMTDENTKLYKAWDKAMNGDIAAQMDDWS